MRILTALSLLLFVGAGSALASDCAIDNAVQTDTDVTGACSNNGEPIECGYAIDGSVSCTGPDGTFSGDNLDALVMSACGCGR